jgi:hypothetical protein
MGFEQGIRLFGVLALTLAGACTRTGDSAPISSPSSSPAPPLSASTSPPPTGRDGREARSVGGEITCESAVEVIKNRCGPLVTRYAIRPQYCSIHPDPQVWIGSVPKSVGKRTFVSYVASATPSPEWFVSEDGRWWAVNGVAKTACPAMAEFREYIRERELATVATRGSDGKSYEGVYARDGNWRFPDCSEFEIKVANIVQDELFRNLDEDEDRALKRASKKAGLTRKVASEIYAKITAQCPYSVGKSR